VSIDNAVVHAAQDRRAPTPDALFETLSNPWVLYAVGAVLLGVAAYRSRSVAPLLAAAIALPVTTILTSFLKSWIGRARPPLVDHTIHVLGTLPTDMSFPSGHASTTFAAIAVVTAYLLRLRPPLLVAGALVALSRVWLGVHYPSDVIVGAALGYGIGRLAVTIVRRLPSDRLRETR
jgi:undecaprenyl-diphosphatase